MKKSYRLISLDIIDGIDGNFYIVDINGLIGVRPILLFQDVFNKNITEKIGSDYHFECPELKSNPNAINNFDLINKNLNLDSNITIYNTSFSFENKLEWRRKLKLDSPNIGINISYHDYDSYPKYLIKPQMSLQGKGILLFNDFNPNLNDESIKKIKQSYGNLFLEQFIPSKLIDNHCYSVRVLLLVNQNECHPVLFANRLCYKPIIQNLNRGRLSDDDSLSYISNRTFPNIDYDVSKFYRINTDERIREFIKNVVINI